MHDFVKAVSGTFPVSCILSLSWLLKEIIVLVHPLDRLEEDCFIRNFTLDGMFSPKSACQLVHGDQVWKKL